MGGTQAKSKSFTKAGTPCMDYRNGKERTTLNSVEECTKNEEYKSSFIFIYENKGIFYATRYNRASVITYLRQMKPSGNENYGMASFEVWNGNGYVNIYFPPLNDGREFKYTKMFTTIIDDDRCNYILITVPSVEIGILNPINDEIEMIDKCRFFNIDAHRNEGTFIHYTDPSKYALYNSEYDKVVVENIKKNGNKRGR